MTDKEVYDRLFDKIDRIDEKLDKVNLELTEIKHIKEDIASHNKRLDNVEKVTTTVSVLFKTILTAGGLTGVIKLFFQDKLS